MPLRSIELGPSPFMKRLKVDPTSPLQTTPFSNPASSQQNGCDSDPSATTLEPVARSLLPDTATSARTLDQHIGVGSCSADVLSYQIASPPRQTSITWHRENLTPSTVALRSQDYDVSERPTLQAKTTTAAPTTALTTLPSQKKTASNRKSTIYSSLGDIFAKFSRPVPPSENILRRPRSFLRTGLGRLPPEIRELIWAYVLSPQGALATDVDVYQPVGLTDAFSCIALSEAPPLSMQDKVFCPALFRVCRLVYLEAQNIYYAKVMFRFTDPSSLIGFLKKIGTGHRLAITVVRLGGLTSKKPMFTEGYLDERCRNGHIGVGIREDLAAVMSDCEHPKAKEAAAYLKECKHLKTIHLDMKAGEEYLYIFFLFHVYGFGKFVVDFPDAFHWTVRWAPKEFEEWLPQFPKRAGPQGLDWGVDNLGNDRLVEVDVGLN